MRISLKHSYQNLNRFVIQMRFNYPLVLVVHSGDAASIQHVYQRVSRGLDLVGSRRSSDSRGGGTFAAVAVCVYGFVCRRQLAVCLSLLWLLSLKLA